jgi:uncharacterized protein with HEPN domain
MRPEERDAALLWDMLVHARRAQRFVAGRTLDNYRSDQLLRSAVERVVQVIGEAASKVSQSFRAANPGVPWQPIIKQRHILVHEYGVIDDEKIWRVATLHVPALIGMLESLIPPPPANPLDEPPEDRQND